MQSLRAALLLSIFVLVTLILIPWQSTALRFRRPRRKSFPQRYHRFLCRLFGIRVRVIGTAVQSRGVLMVANHSSWLDILTLSAAARISFVAKSEVQTWPFFSLLARLQETVFVDRVRRSQTAEARDQIRQRLIEGDALVLFPEGTSSDGNRVLPFKSALMGAADAEIGRDPVTDRPIYVPVQPVSVSYVGVHGLPMGRDLRPFFAWYGDMELVPHLWEAFKTGPIEVIIEFHKPMTIDQLGGRKALCSVAETVVRQGQARALSGHIPVPASEASGDEAAAADFTEAVA
jgi:1-acyl-sn-glycerol-3-phosphate acyltransferase